MAYQKGLPTNMETVAELGPGDSLGIRLAALLSGADRYYALDVVRHSSTDRNIAILDELVELFMRREDIPDSAEFPNLKPLLDSYFFPRNILTENVLGSALRSERIDALRSAIFAAHSGGSQNTQITYCVPWQDTKLIREDTLEMVFSQACLEHVFDLEITYQTLYRWLKPGGYMSHQVDFKSHGTAREWNGHWTYSNLVWRLIKGARPYLLNRQPLSAHLKLMQQEGFQIKGESVVKMASNIRREQLAEPFVDLTESDLTTSSAFVQAVK